MNHDALPHAMRNPLSRQIISDIFDDTHESVRALVYAARAYAIAVSPGVGLVRLIRARCNLHRAARNLAAIFIPYPAYAVRGYLETIREVSTCMLGERIATLIEAAVTFADKGKSGPLRAAARDLDLVVRESLSAGL